MNWTEIAEGVKAKMMDLGPNAVPLVVLEVPEPLITMEGMDALALAWDSVRGEVPRARLIVTGPESEMEWHGVGTPEGIERIAARVHTAWMAEKQRQGYADHAYDYRLHDGPRCCDKPHYFHHADMVPFGQLSDATKEYDRATVRAVLEAVMEETS